MLVEIVLVNKYATFQYDVSVNKGAMVRMISVKALEWHLRGMGMKRAHVSQVVDVLLDKRTIVFELVAQKKAA